MSTSDKEKLRRMMGEAAVLSPDDPERRASASLHKSSIALIGKDLRATTLTGGEANTPPALAVSVQG